MLFFLVETDQSRSWVRRDGNVFRSDVFNEIYNNALFFLTRKIAIPMLCKTIDLHCVMSFQRVCTLSYRLITIGPASLRPTPRSGGVVAVLDPTATSNYWRTGDS